MEVAALTAFLAPFLPALLRPVGQAVDALADRAAEEAMEHAKGLWGRLADKVRGKPAAAEAAEKVADAPDDERWRTALELQLEELLRGDTELAREIEALWASATAAGVTATGERSVAVGGDVSGVVITGDGSSVTR